MKIINKINLNTVVKKTILYGLCFSSPFIDIIFKYIVTIKCKR